MGRNPATKRTDESRWETADHVISSGRPITEYRRGLEFNSKTANMRVIKRRRELSGEPDPKDDDAELREARRRFRATGSFDGASRPRLQLGDRLDLLLKRDVAAALRIGAPLSLVGREHFDPLRKQLPAGVSHGAPGPRNAFPVPQAAIGSGSLFRLAVPGSRTRFFGMRPPCSRYSFRQRRSAPRFG